MHLCALHATRSISWRVQSAACEPEARQEQVWNILQQMDVRELLTKFLKRPVSSLVKSTNLRKETGISGSSLYTVLSINLSSAWMYCSSCSTWAENTPKQSVSHSPPHYYYIQKKSTVIMDTLHIAQMLPYDFHLFLKHFAPVTRAFSIPTTFKKQTF